MIIQRLEVKNFRSLKDVGVDCHELVAILGRNGCGKSSLLKAIEAFYDVSFLANAFDYFSKDTTSEISIRITYLKNPEAAARLIRIVYEAGHKVPVLEKIVEAVSALI